MKTTASLLAPALAVLVLGFSSVACGSSVKNHGAAQTEGPAAEGEASESTVEASDAADRLPPIVARSIEHHGGEVFRHSRSSMEVCSASGCFYIESMIDGDRFEHVVETAPEEGAGEGAPPARRVRWTNDTIEEWRGGEAQELDEETARRARDFVSARTYFPHLPFRLADDSVYFEDQGLETWGDRELHRVKVTFTPGSSTDADDEYLYWFDPETGELEQFAYSFHSGDEIGLRFRELINERRLGGVLIADQTNLGTQAPGLSVDDIDPEFVEEKMEEVSIVRFQNITMRRLEG